MTKIIPGLCLATLALGLAGCMSPSQQRFQVTNAAFHQADLTCPPKSSNVAGHHAAYWDCARDVVAIGDPNDATVAYSMAQEAKLAEDADAGKMSEGDYQVMQTRLRMETSDQVDAQNARADSVAAQQNASGAVGLLAVVGAVADIVLLTR